MGRISGGSSSETSPHEITGMADVAWGSLGWFPALGVAFWRTSAPFHADDMLIMVGPYVFASDPAAFRPSRCLFWRFSWDYRSGSSPSLSAR